MIGARDAKIFVAAGAKALVFLVFVALAGCVSGSQPEPPPTAAPPSPPVPPPVDLAGRWRLTAAAGGACFMTFGATGAGAAQGTIAPEGGCPGNFFTSRKWTFEHDALIIRDHRGEQLAQLSYTGGHFEGRDTNGGALSLTRETK